MAKKRYSKEHEWIEEVGPNIFKVGITEYAVDSLGDIVYVDLPAVGKHVKIGEDTTVVESVKAASDIYAPVSGEILEVNTALQDTPEIMNESPYEQGWLFTISCSNTDELSQLLDEDAYNEFIKSL